MADILGYEWFFVSRYLYNTMRIVRLPNSHVYPRSKMDCPEAHQDYTFYPLSSIFSAAHSDAQAKSSEAIPASDHFHEFEMAVHRLGQFRRGYRGFESGEVEERDQLGQAPNLLRFSSRVEDKLAGLNESWEVERRPESLNHTQDGIERVEITEDVMWKVVKER